MESKKLSKSAYEGVKGKDYVPYVREKSSSEGSPVVLIAAILLAILFAASTAYSGMKAGLTVAAGIPGSILGSVIVAALAKEKGILGKNLLQGASSGGESIASGMIFVLPAVIILGYDLGLVEGVLVGVAGALFGIGISTLVHDYLLVEEHGVLPYPESMAIAETLVASEGAKESVKYMGIGFLISGILTLVSGSVLNLANNLFKFVKETGYKVQLSIEASPMLLGIGYIVGIEVGMALFAGSLLANFAVLPLIGYFSELAADSQMVWNNPSLPINAMAVSDIANSYLKYIGAGMMLSGGLIGAIKLIPVIVSSVKKTLGTAPAAGEGKGVGIYALIISVVLTALMAFIISSGNIAMTIIAGLLSMFFGVLFVIVAGHLTGTIGTSNLPVSGMTIASLVVITVVFRIMGWVSPESNKALLLFGTFVVTAIAIGGGYMQSQKVGFVLGGDKNVMTKYFSIASIAGVVTVTAMMILFASKIGQTGVDAEFALPQANMMATLTSGILEGNLPWAMIIAGAVMGVFFFLLKLPVMSVAVGFYLPIATTSIILIGGILRLLIEKTSKSVEDKEAKISNGISLSAGLVAGASIIGLIGIILQVFGIITPGTPEGFLASNGSALVTLAILFVAVYLVISKSGTKND